MKLITTVIFVFVCSFAFSQDNSGNEGRNHFVITSGGNYYNDIVWENRDPRKIGPGIGYNNGIEFYLPVNKRWFIGLGLHSIMNHFTDDEGQLVYTHNYWYFSRQLLIEVRIAEKYILSFGGTYDGVYYAKSSVLYSIGDYGEESYWFYEKKNAYQRSKGYGACANIGYSLFNKRKLSLYGGGGIKTYNLNKLQFRQLAYSLSIDLNLFFDL
ncbi:MAG: hypothetical protein ABIJ97_17690 [Bacteroidota bacterium]